MKPYARLVEIRIKKCAKLNFAHYLIHLIINFLCLLKDGKGAVMRLFPFLGTFLHAQR